MQKILIFLVSLLLSGLLYAEPAALLVYKVWEQGGEPYFSRILVTARHVRMDEGRDRGDFTLFDRDEETLFNVAADERSVLILEPQLDEVSEAKDLILSEQVSVDQDAPRIAGKQPETIDLFANDEKCARVVAVQGLMEDAVSGLRELRKVLSRIHSATQARQPAEMPGACDQADNIHAPTRFLDHGLPIEQHSKGSVQLLIDFSEQYEADPVLFKVPDDFNRVRLPALPMI